jgi:cell division protein FtsL
MTEVVHADIFFFITAIAVVLVTILFSIALVFAIFILRDIRAVTMKVRKASDELEQDFESLRLQMKNEGVRVKTIFELALGFLKRQIPRARSKKKAKEDDTK